MAKLPEGPWIYKINRQGYRVIEMPDGRSIVVMRGGLGYDIDDVLTAIKGLPELLRAAEEMGTTLRNLVRVHGLKIPILLRAKEMELEKAVKACRAGEVE